MGRHVWRGRQIGGTGFIVDGPTEDVEIGECPIDPPAKKKKRHSDQRNDHDVFHQRVEVILAATHTDFVHAKTHMD